MSKINQIERAILELDGGVFQKLANAYLICEGYDGLNAIGSVVGSNKVCKGTPDAAFYWKMISTYLLSTQHSRQIFSKKSKAI